MNGRRIRHEALAARACRQRRLRLGQAPAQYVVDEWRQRQRIMRYAKALAKERQDRIHRPFGRDFP